MSQNKQIVVEAIEEIESSVKKGFKKEEFVKKFRDKIDKYIKNIIEES